MAEKGTIYKATGGFYYVALDGGDFRVESAPQIECRPRGIFRKEGRKPLVGDVVLVEHNPDGDGGTIDDILPRRNQLIRPPLANLDHMVVVLSVKDPAPNYVVVDKLLAVLEHKAIAPVIAITKSDLEDPDPLAAIYRQAGFPVYITDCVSGAGIPELIRHLAGSFSAFCGNSGVGKSSLLNAIDPALGLTVGDTSRKLGRGRHTTRHVETHRLAGNALVADTPGFTSLELAQMSTITAQELAECFREFAHYSTGCKFQDCTHTVEKGCRVLTALAQGKIAPSRHASYCQLYNEMKDVKEWQRRST